jgi:hypothetical protein
VVRAHHPRRRFVSPALVGPNHLVFGAAAHPMQFLPSAVADNWRVLCMGNVHRQEPRTRGPHKPVVPVAEGVEVLCGLLPSFVRVRM